MAGSTKLKWSPEDDTAVNAQRELPALVAEFFATTRQTMTEPNWPRNLHRVRLASKKLRYTLELFRPIYPAALEARLDKLKKLQDWLGEANDAAASRKLLGGATLRRHPELRDFLETRAATQAEAFTRYWKKTFDANGQEKWWTDFLSRKARAPK